MRPLNHQERNSLFWQFMFVFIGVVTVVLFALYFDFEMPQQLTDLQKRRLEESEGSVKNQKEVIRLLDTINGSIKQMPNAPNPGEARDDVGSNISKLKEMGGQNVMVRKMADIMASYSAAQYIISSSNKNSQDNNKQLNDCKDAQQRWQKKFDDLEILYKQLLAQKMQ